MGEQTKKSNNFITQAVILGIATIVVRFLGLIYQMPLTRIIGDMGNGYYSYAYNIYSMLLLISSFSIPIAVSKMVSERVARREFRNAQKVFKASMLYVIIISTILAVFTMAFSGVLIPKSQAGAIPALRVLCPVIILAGILGVLRGYFQGYNTMIPTSFSQILEGVLNAIISVLSAYILVIPYAAGSVKRAKYGAVGSTLGTAAGVLIGLAFMLFLYQIYKPTIRKRVRRDRTEHREDYNTIFKVILWTVTPVLLSSFVFNICPVIDQTLFASILQKKGIVGEDISVLQGIYSAKYLKLVSLPVSIASALSSAIIPAITYNVINKKKKEANQKIDMALRFIMLISIPCTLGLIILAEPIMLLFGRSTTLVVATHVLMFGAVNVIFNCISTLTNAVLQGLDDLKSPIIHSVIALIVHIIVCVVFLNRGFGIYALLIGTMAFSLVIWVLNAIAIYRITGYKSLFGSRVGRILFASFEMAVCTVVFYYVPTIFLGKGYEYVGLAISLVVSVISYIFFLLLSNALGEEDYEMLPMGGKLKELGLKFHMIETEDQPFEEEMGELYTEEKEKKPDRKFIFRKQETVVPEPAEEEEQNVNSAPVKTMSAHTGAPKPIPHREEEKQAPKPVTTKEEAAVPTLHQEGAMVNDMVSSLAKEQLEAAVKEDKKEEEQRIAETEEIDVLKILERLQKQEEEASKKLEEAKDSRNEE